MKKSCHIIMPEFNYFISDRILFHDNIATNDIQIHFKTFKISEVDHFYTAIGIKERLHLFLLIKTV